MKQNLKNINTIIFDMDGIIFNSEAVWKEAFFKANEIYNLNFTEEFRQFTCGQNEHDIREKIKEIAQDLDIVKYREYMNNYCIDIIKNQGIPLKPGFVELIKFLKDNNYKIALATSSDKKLVDNLFEKVNINYIKIFDAIITGDEVITSKPDPTIFLNVIKKLNEEPKNCIVLEDSINGLEAAYNAKCSAFMVIDIIQPNDRAKKFATKIFNSLLEVLEFLKNNKNH